MKILKARHTTRHITDGIADEVLFNRLLSMERKRSERTGAPFLLVLINFERLVRSRVKRPIEEIGAALAASIRDTDVTGWHRNRSTIGVIFTSLKGTSRAATRTAVSGKIQKLLAENLHASEIGSVEISFHFFPESDEPGGDCIESGRVLYAEHEDEDIAKKTFSVVKRSVDIVGSLFALSVLSPAFVVIAVLIKMTSDGPIFYQTASPWKIRSRIYISEVSFDVCGKRFEDSPGIYAEPHSWKRGQPEWSLQNSERSPDHPLRPHSSSQQSG